MANCAMLHVIMPSNGAKEEAAASNEVFAAGHVEDLESRNFVRQQQRSIQGGPKFVLKVARMASGTWLAYRRRCNVAVLPCRCCVSLGATRIELALSAKWAAMHSTFRALLTPSLHLNLFRCGLHLQQAHRRGRGGSCVCATLLTCCRFTTLGRHVRA